MTEKLDEGQTRYLRSMKGLSPSVRLQIMAREHHVMLLDSINEEHDWQLNYSKCFAILAERYKKYQRVIEQMRDYTEEIVAKNKQLEYEVKQKHLKEV
jgi:hypothetical protein